MPENRHTTSATEYPHPDNPGLAEVPGHGYIDWAGRRLFLPDGSPDPATPGAYRYQTRPDLCDLEAPDSDPASPRYEPPHLRHQPGDTWEIGGKLHDPDDPGPYGSPGWYQDRRTGRHRRGELPDPIPPWEQQPDNHTPTPKAAPQPAPPVTPDRPSPGPYRRRYGTDERPTEEPYRFSRLREDAWDRWLIDSEPLARAHQTTHTAAERESGRTITALIRLIKWIIAVLRAEPAPRDDRPERDDPASLRTVPTNPPVPRPRGESRYITAWERRFDAQYPVTGGAAL